MEEMREMLELRAAWVAKGRPADENDPYWAATVAEVARKAAANRGRE